MCLIIDAILTVGTDARVAGWAVFYTESLDATSQVAWNLLRTFRSRVSERSFWTVLRTDDGAARRVYAAHYDIVITTRRLTGAQLRVVKHVFVVWIVVTARTNALHVTVIRRYAIHSTLATLVLLRTHLRLINASVQTLHRVVTRVVGLRTLRNAFIYIL